MRLEIDLAAVRPLIDAAVEAAIQRAGDQSQRIAYSEAEAAELLGMAVHQLRDRRLEGKVKAKRVGKSYYYTRQELLRLVTPGK